jgi:hypothetical protein
MLNIAAMSQGDAQQTLQVYQWIKEHLPEITDLAENSHEAGVTASAEQGLFHQTYTCLESTRFVPLTVALFTDEDTLYAGGETEPNVLLYQPLDRRTYAVVDHLHTQDLSEVANLFGISGEERTWRKSEK